MQGLNLTHEAVLHETSTLADRLRAELPVRLPAMSAIVACGWCGEVRLVDRLLGGFKPNATSHSTFVPLPKTPGPGEGRQGAVWVRPSAAFDKALFGLFTTAQPDAYSPLNAHLPAESRGQRCRVDRPALLGLVALVKIRAFASVFVPRSASQARRAAWKWNGSCVVALSPDATVAVSIVTCNHHPSSARWSARRSNS